jgi:hypothetical protein
LHDIPYVLDRTNFQPELTLRNAIRHVLARNEKKHQRSAEIVVRTLTRCTIAFYQSRLTRGSLYEGARRTSSSFGGQGYTHTDGRQGFENPGPNRLDGKPQRPS